MSGRKAPISMDGFQNMVERLSARAKIGFPVHALMLRHAWGFKPMNDGVDTRTIHAFLGHKDIRHTVRYTELSTVRFKGLWGGQRPFRLSRPFVAAGGRMCRWRVSCDVRWTLRVS